MGKNLKGKECGEGLSQRKDGLYSARFLTKSGKRKEKYFRTLPEARNWLADAKYLDKHDEYCVASGMKVSEWFEFWDKNIKCDVAPNTHRNYRERFNRNIKPVIGSMEIGEVKPMHCKIIFNRMSEEYAGSTIRQTYITMGIMFRDAVNNGVIIKHPMDGVRFTKPVRDAGDIRFLTVEEQRIFLEYAKKSHNYRQYALILETGLRTGEMIGLTWDAIDWKKRTLTVDKSLEYRYTTGAWSAGPPKTKSGYRTIPLSKTAYKILEDLYSERYFRKESPLLEEELEFIDRISGKTRKLVMKDLVFINWRTGEPNKNSSYDTHLYKICDAAGIPRFSMHALRHTYATRAIEAGMQPKVLQMLLGHVSLKTTMDRYVHVTDDSLRIGMEQFELHKLNCQLA